MNKLKNPKVWKSIIILVGSVCVIYGIDSLTIGKITVVIDALANLIIDIL